jgi:hypothetical protein
MAGKPATLDAVTSYFPTRQPAGTPNASTSAIGHIIRPSAISGGAVVPYVTSWSDEKKLPAEIIMRTSMGISFGIAFADETAADRDRDGILWTRKPDHHRQGRPEFGNIHSRRQRRAMRLLLCQVCAQPADRDEDGVLWLLPDYYAEAQGWPENYDLAEPPICRSCVPVATRLCPALRRGHLGIRARSAPVCGVRGLVYGPSHPAPVLVGDYEVRYDNPTIRWTVADQLLRTLQDCTPVDLHQYRQTQHGHDPQTGEDQHIAAVRHRHHPPSPGP